MTQHGGKTQGHRARKRFGQNFLHDEQVVARLIAAIAPRVGDHIVEIGPGLGALSKPLGAALGDKGTLTLVELDRDLAARLDLWVQQNPHIELLQGDALQFDFIALAEPSKRLRAVGNLPYNISTPLLFTLLEQHQAFAATHGGELLFADMHFMLQQEVVERICATPGSKQFGRLSVMMQYFAKVEALFGVPPEAFEPRPAVNSSILRVVPHAQLPFPAQEPQRFAALVSAAFAQRRKTLRNNLKGVCDSELLTRLGIDPTCRAETLSVQQFVAIANALSSN